MSEREPEVPISPNESGPRPPVPYVPDENGDYPDGTTEDTDWCPRCNKITRYEGEVCTQCGRTWGEN